MTTTDNFIHFINLYFFEIGVAFFCFGLLLFVIDMHLLTFYISEREQKNIKEMDKKGSPFRLWNDKRTKWEFFQRYLIQLLHNLALVAAAALFLLIFDQDGVTIGGTFYHLSLWSLIPLVILFYGGLNFIFAYCIYKKLKLNLRVRLMGKMEDVYADYFKIKLKSLASLYPKEQLPEFKIQGVIIPVLARVAYLAMLGGGIIILSLFWGRSGNYIYIVEVRFICFIVSSFVYLNSLNSLYEYITECIFCSISSKKQKRNLIIAVGKKCLQGIVLIILFIVSSFFGHLIFEKFFTLTDNQLPLSLVFGVILLIYTEFKLSKFSSYQIEND